MSGTRTFKLSGHVLAVSVSIYILLACSILFQPSALKQAEGLEASMLCEIVQEAHARVKQPFASCQD